MLLVITILERIRISKGLLVIVQLKYKAGMKNSHFLPVSRIISKMVRLHCVKAHRQSMEKPKF